MRMGRVCLFVFLVFICFATAHSSLAESAGTLVYPRALHSAVLLKDGRVLICGGQIAPDGAMIFTKTAEIYDPATRTWTRTGQMNMIRIRPGCVLLPDGRVLVAGSAISSHTAEIYDPVTGVWTFTGRMHQERDPTLILLPTGKVLAAGGSDDVVSCELYDPATGTWSYTGSLNHKRLYQTTLLATGQVLASGGIELPNGFPIRQSELYDPSTGAWSDTGLEQFPRFFQQQLLLPNGRVLVAGGETGNHGGTADIPRCEVYDPMAGNWNVVGSLATPRVLSSSSLLGDGKALIAGGIDKSGQVTSSIEEYNPHTNNWSTPSFALATPRYYHTQTSLLDGSVLIAGGNSSIHGALAAEAEVFFDP